jgi:hypothetical protein
MLRGAGNTERSCSVPSSLLLSPFKSRSDQQNKCYSLTHACVWAQPLGKQGSKTLKKGHATTCLVGRRWWKCGPPNAAPTAPGCQAARLAKTRRPRPPRVESPRLSG